MDHGQLPGAVFLDLKKAFYTVYAEKFIKCLGINNTEQACFLNYLIDGVRCVSFLWNYFSGMLCLIRHTPEVHPWYPFSFI